MPDSTALCNSNNFILRELYTDYTIEFSSVVRRGCRVGRVTIHITPVLGIGMVHWWNGLYTE